MQEIPDEEDEQEEQEEQDPSELEYLKDLLVEVTEAQQRAEKQNEQIQKGFGMDQSEQAVNQISKTIATFNSIKSPDEDIEFMVDNAVLDQAVGKRKLEQDNSNLLAQILERNQQVRTLITRVKYLEDQVEIRDRMNQRLDIQVANQNKNISSLKKKFEEEHRERIVSEALRKPKQPLLSNVRQGLLDSGGFQDGNVRGDPHDFWSSGNEAQNLYPGKPKKIHDLVNPNSIWVNRSQPQNIQIGQGK